MAGCRDYTTQAEQEICRQAALSFFSTCVKAALLHNDVAIPLVSLHIDASDNLDARIPYYMLFEVDVPTELENVSVLLGGVQDIGYCLQDVTVQSSISTEDGLIFSIMLDLADVQFTVGSTVDLIVAVNDSLTSNPIAIDINAVTLEDSFDLNGDGAFDSRDYLAALIQYGNGELDTDTFYGILGEYYRR
ncbi:MAG: hypothetical protein ED559_08640 [Phycisphaera sp.]|nr:MAG: hypothetical protein ED559_08640 [Phycisphaera sp.]